METTTKTTAAVLATVDTLDTFAAQAGTTLEAGKLREMMVILDPELGTPLYWIDHRVRSTRNSGQAEFMAHNLESGHFETIRIGSRVSVPVMAK